MSPPKGLRRYNASHGQEHFADLFALRLDAFEMRCRLSTHPLGWELHLTVGQQLLRSHVCKTESEVFGQMNAWYQDATTKGWR